MLSSLSWNLWESTIYFSSGADGDQWVRLALFEHTDVVRARRHCCSMAAANKPSFYGNNSWFSGGCVSWRVDSCIVKSVASKVWVWQRIAANVTHVWAFNMVVKQGARVYPASNWWMLCLCQSATKTSSFEHACVETEAAWWLFIDNPCLVCSPFNADFDDDTMVMHLTLSNQSQSWLQDICRRQGISFGLRTDGWWLALHRIWSLTSTILLHILQVIALKLLIYRNCMRFLTHSRQVPYWQYASFTPCCIAQWKKTSISVMIWRYETLCGWMSRASLDIKWVTTQYPQMCKIVTCLVSFVQTNVLPSLCRLMPC